MTLALTSENKNSLSITNEDKPTGGTFGDFPGRAFSDGGMFGEPGTFLTAESKNSLAITNENKT